MRKSMFTEIQIVQAPRQVEGWRQVLEVLRWLNQQQKLQRRKLSVRRLPAKS